MSDEWRIEFEQRPPEEGYPRLGLTRNPFSASGLAPETPQGLPLSVVRKQLEEFVVGFLTTGQYRAAVLIGEYGSGKTHHLRLLEQLFRRDPATRVVYLSSAHREPRQVIDAVLQEIGAGDLAKLVWNPILAELRKVNEEDSQALWHVLGTDKLRQSMPAQSVALFPLRSSIESSLTDYRNFLTAFSGRREFSLRMLRDFAIRTLAQHLEISSPAAAALFDTTDDETLRSASATDALFSASTKRSAPKEGEILLGLTRLLRSDGTRRLVILIDEFEGVSMLERMTHKQSVDYLYALRMLIDETAHRASYALVIATTPAAYDKMVDQLYTATKGRFQYAIYLPVVDEATAREILSRTLATARADEPDEDSIQPFTDGFLNAVLSKGKLTPRALTILAHRAIERAAQDATMKQIDADVVSEVGI